MLEQYYEFPKVLIGSRPPARARGVAPGAGGARATETECDRVMDSDQQALLTAAAAAATLATALPPVPVHPCLLGTTEQQQRSSGRHTHRQQARLAPRV